MTIDRFSAENEAAADKADVAAFWTSHGFAETSTGGGFVGYVKMIGTDGAHILVTDSVDEGMLPQSITEPHDVGHYNANGEQTSFSTVADAWQALALCAS